MTDRTVDRLANRSRPDSLPVMHQTWDKLAFLHWRIPSEELQRHVPRGIEIDSFDGSGWIGVTPFTMRGVRPVFMPALPVISSTHEINVRTYVVQDGVPGVWFFSLDASSRLAVWLARLTYSLPYYHASMSIYQEDDGTLRYRSERRAFEGDAGSPPLFEASWRPTGEVFEPQPGSLEFFLVERYCLYTMRRGVLQRARVWHPPWKLQAADLVALESTMLESQGLPDPRSEPTIHAQAEPLRVQIWPLEKV